MASSQCCTNPPCLDPVYGKGTMEDNIGGCKAYTTGSCDCSKPVIVLISDVFGIEAPNLRNIADKVAEFGFHVVVPDLFRGDPLPPNDLRQLPDWLQRHKPENGIEHARAVVQALKDRGLSTIGAAGFCWGGKVVVDLAKTDLIKAAVLLHPSFVTIDDVKEVKCPISILGAEIDKTTPPELTKQFDEILSSRPEVESYVKIFPGVVHGWANRYDDNDKAALEKAEEAHKLMLDWFLKHVR